MRTGGQTAQKHEFSAQIESGEKSWVVLVILPAVGTDRAAGKRCFGFRKTEIGSVGDIKEFGPEIPRARRFRDGRGL